MQRQHDGEETSFPRVSGANETEHAWTKPAEHLLMHEPACLPIAQLPVAQLVQCHQSVLRCKN
ncbi:MAG: hypothetical protein QOC79_1964 [Actinomycetota bacterium]|nr:hypothetical protein [Actinomycetota bacterium]